MFPPSPFPVSAAVYAGALAYWVYFCRENRDDVHQVHIMMAALGLAKVLSLFFESLSYSAIAAYGALLLAFLLAFLLACERVLLNANTRSNRGHARACAICCICCAGRPIGWNVLFYIFYFVKALMLFVVILLVGT